MLFTDAHMAWQDIHSGAAHTLYVVQKRVVWPPSLAISLLEWIGWVGTDRGDGLEGLDFNTRCDEIPRRIQVAA